MDISPIGNGNYYIIIDEEELGGCDAAELVQHSASVFSKDMFLEIFQGTEGAIVFARVRRGNPMVFSFSGLEAVISAALLCDSDCVVFLAFEAGEFKLIYYPWGDELPPAALCEFCVSERQAHPDYQRHIAEQGGLLLGPCAAQQLKEMFA